MQVNNSDSVLSKLCEEKQLHYVNKYENVVSECVKLLMSVATNGMFDTKEVKEVFNFEKIKEEKKLEVKNAK